VLVGSDGFFVDPVALSGACAGVSQLLGQMEEFVEVGEPASSSVFGHEELAEAAEFFQERWRGGVASLASDVEVIHSRLGETLDEYRRVDQGAAALFRGVFGEA
jgi:hypothetical protein